MILQATGDGDKDTFMMEAGLCFLGETISQVTGDGDKDIFKMEAGL